LHDAGGDVVGLRTIPNAIALAVLQVGDFDCDVGTADLGICV
jgi:hypothetical protein